MKSKILIGILAVVIVVGGVIFGIAKNNKTENQVTENIEEDNTNIIENMNENTTNTLVENNNSNEETTQNISSSNQSTDNVSLEIAEKIVQTAFDKAKEKSSDGNVTVNNIVENMESGWKLVNVNISTNSKQPTDGSKVTERMLNIIVNDQNNEHSGVTHLIIANESTKRQFSVSIRANADKSIQIPAGTDIITKSYELEV